MMILRCQKGPKRGQNGVKNDPKSKHKSKMKKAALWDRVWVVWGSFWRQSWGQKSLKNIGFYKVSWQITFLEQIRFGGTFVVDFGSILAPKWRPNGIQNAPKTLSKINQKHDWIFDRFLEASGKAAQVQGEVKERASRPFGDPPPPKSIS